MTFVDFGLDGFDIIVLCRKRRTGVTEGDCSCGGAFKKIPTGDRCHKPSLQSSKAGARGKAASAAQFLLNSLQNLNAQNCFFMKQKPAARCLFP